MFEDFLRVFKRELERLSSNFVLVFISVIGPVFIFLVIYWMFSAGVIRDLPIAVVDKDFTNVSRKITRLSDASPVAKITEKTGGLTAARKLMDLGKVEAILYIPEGTEKHIYRGETASIRLYINNTNLVKSGAIKSGLYKTLTTISTGIKLQTYQKKGAAYEEAMVKAMPVRLNAKSLFNPFNNYAYFLALGLLPMLFTVFIFLGTLYVLGQELKDGTSGELLKMANNNMLVAMSGKLIPYAFMFFVDAMVMNLVLFHILGTPLRGALPVVLLSELLLIMAYQTLSILFLNVTSNLRLSLSIGSAYTMMALSFSGLTFPAMGMPVVAKMLSYLFPYTLWLKVFIGQTLQGEPIMVSYKLFLGLSVFIIVGLLAMPGLKKKMNNPEKWGKA